MKTKKILKPLLLFAICYLLIAPQAARCASVVATVDGNPITDVDITARTKLMAIQGNTATDNRRQALSNIIDDYIKLNYAASMKIAPTDADVNKEIAAMKAHGFGTSSLDATGSDMMRSAVRANIAWQMVVGRTIMPTINITSDDIDASMADLEREKGLPIELVLIRLVDIPTDVAAKLTKPASCDAAEAMAKNLGGAPQKMTVNEYDLSSDIRNRLIGLPLLTWSARADNSVLLICSKKKTKEYGKLDDMVRQNAMFKHAMFAADQQLKQLRRKAVIIINDDRYKDK